MRKGNAAKPFQIDEVRFADCFKAPSLRQELPGSADWEVALRKTSHSCRAHGLLGLLYRVGPVRQSVPQLNRSPPPLYLLLGKAFPHLL